jgi:putative FmdB family regulatory protein
MPIYEYACKQCDHEFETLVLGDEAVECPKCQGSKLQRLLSVPGAPKVNSAGLPMACDSNLPPCGPGCCRL